MEKSKLNYQVHPESDPYLQITKLGYLEEIPSGKKVPVYCRPVIFSGKIYWSICLDLEPIESLSIYRYMIPETGQFVHSEIVANFIGATRNEENEAKKAFYLHHSGLEIGDKFSDHKVEFYISKIGFPTIECKQSRKPKDWTQSHKYNISTILKAKEATLKGEEFGDLLFQIKES